MVIKVIIKYDKLEAMKNKCHPITYGKFIFEMLLITIIAVVLFIFSPFILKDLFPIIYTTLIRYLIVFFILLGIPILLIKLYLNKIKWFSAAFVLRDNAWYLVQLINHRLIKDSYKGNIIYPDVDVQDDSNYINMLDKWFKQEKIEGEVIKLEKINFIKENKKYYYYSYVNNGIQKKLKIPKAYNNLISILR